MPLDEIIRSLDIPIVRNHELEEKWSYKNYSAKVMEAIQYHCKKSFVSEYMKHQISKFHHQGYILVGNNFFASPVRSIYTAMEDIEGHKSGRGVLKNISKAVGFEILHVHFAQSSCIVENWVNHARRDGLNKVTHDDIYNSLMFSLSKPKKTGEWIIYSVRNGVFEFWCIWLHSASDEDLIDVIKSQLHV